MLSIKMVASVAVVAVRSSGIGPEVEQALAQCYKLMEGAAVVLDLSSVESLGSVGVRVLLAFRAKLRESGGELVLARLSERLMRVLDVVGLLKVFGAYPDVQTAVGALGPGELAKA